MFDPQLRASLENKAVQKLYSIVEIDLTKADQTRLNTNTAIVKSQGVNYAVVITDLLPIDFQKKLIASVLDYVDKGMLVKDHDHTNGSYSKRTPRGWKNERVPCYGATYLSYSRHPTGQTHRPSIPSLALVGSCEKFVYGMKVLKDLENLSLCANFLIMNVDQVCHAKLERLRTKIIAECPHAEAICSVTPALHTVLGIVVNRRSGSHRDNLDAIGVWGVMFVLGDFTGGEMKFTIGGKSVCTRFQSGDAILLKARDVTHEVMVWEGEIRVTLVYYTQQSVMVEYGV